MTDKNTVLQVLGALMAKPQYLSHTDKYILTPGDFQTKLDKYIFAAIDGLYRNGATRIAPIDIEGYLKIMRLHALLLKRLMVSNTSKTRNTIQTKIIFFFIIAV